MAFSPEAAGRGRRHSRALRRSPSSSAASTPRPARPLPPFWREALRVAGDRPSRSPEAAEMVKLADNLLDRPQHRAGPRAGQAVRCPALADRRARGDRAAPTACKKGQHYVNILYPLQRRRRLLPDQGPVVRAYALGRRAWRRAADPAGLARRQRSMPGLLLRPGAGSARDARAWRRGGPHLRVLGLAFKTNSGDVPPDPGGAARSRMLARQRLRPARLRPDGHRRRGREHHWRRPRALDWSDGDRRRRRRDLPRRRTTSSGRSRPAHFARARAPGALIFDGRMYYPRDRIAELEAAGLGYMGVGRWD